MVDSREVIFSLDIRNEWACRLSCLRCRTSEQRIHENRNEEESERKKNARIIYKSNDMRDIDRWRKTNTENEEKIIEKISKYRNTKRQSKTFAEKIVITVNRTICQMFFFYFVSTIRQNELLFFIWSAPDESIAFIFRVWEMQRLQSLAWGSNRLP